MRAENCIPWTATVLDACCGFRTDRNITSCDTTKWISISYGFHSWGRRPAKRILCMKHRGQWKSIFPCVEMNYSRSKIEQRFRFVCRSPQSAEWKTPNAAHENFNRNNDKRDCKMEEFPRFFEGTGWDDLTLPTGKLRISFRHIAFHFDQRG